MLQEYGHPWIENEESAVRLLDYLRTKEKREFNLEKARVVITQIRETHEKGLATEDAKLAVSDGADSRIPYIGTAYIGP